MAFFQMLGAAFETVGSSIAAGVQLGLNENANNAVVRSANKTATHAVTVGCDVGGFASSTLAPALEVAGHAISSTAIDCARVVTFDQIDDLRNASNHQKGKMMEAHGKVEGGIKRLIGHEDASFGMRFANHTYNHRHNWMSQLQDNIELSQIYVPGTHDSMALYGGDFAQTQRMPLEDQLYAGIRMFDIRVRHLRDDLPIHHGVIYQRANLFGAFQTFRSFFRRYPNEVILARISTAGCVNEGPHSYSFKDAVQKTANEVGVNLKAFKQFTTLAQCRGCVILVPGHGNNKLVECHDNWGTVECEQKYADVAAFACRRNFERGSIKFNYSTGSGTSGMSYVTPAALASMVNYRILNCLAKPHHPQSLMFDYPGQQLIDKVIAWNF